MEPIIILGTGLAGYTLAREYRKLERERPLWLLTADAGAFYSKPMLSNALASGKTPTTLATRSAEQMARQLGAEVRPYTRVTAVDPLEGVVVADGEALRYHRLVLAIGADPIRVPLEGDAAGEVLSVNDLADYTRFREAIDGRQRVAVMGAGLIGCEFANDLRVAGLEVEVVDVAPKPLGRLLPPEAGEAMQEVLAEIGVHWRLGATIRSVERAADRLILTYSDGSRAEVDAVLSAVGLRPRTGLAEAAGLKIERGIMVDRGLASSDARIFALGDCAEVEGLVLPFIMPIMHAARALAKTLAGEPTEVRYPAMPVVVKTPAWPTVVAPPTPEREGVWEVSRTREGLHALFRGERGRLLGFVLSGTAVVDREALTRELPAWLE